MILAGIDEAGYGPVLGPLVVGCCAFRIDDPGSRDWPCLWERLKNAVSKKRSLRKLHINDSKEVYTPAQGLKELERSVLALAAAAYGKCADLDFFLSQAAPDALNDLSEHPWYKAWEGETFPIEIAAPAAGIAANALAVEMRKNGVVCAHLAARLVCERQFNKMMAMTRNKGNTLFSITAVHLDQLLRRFGEENLTIVCDRQGGRQHYGVLRQMFDEWSLEVLEEIPQRSHYVLHRKGHSVRISFCEKAEAQCMSVAVASMLSKYLREALMGRFNAYWTRLVPAAPPTAGYYTDGMRFLRDIEAKRSEMGIADGELIRSR